MEHLYTTEEAAAKLKIHHETMRGYLREHKITGVKIGRSWRVRESDLSAFVNANVPATIAEAMEAMTNDRFMAMLTESAPRIAAGTLRQPTSEDISQAIADARP